jgi:hypothetical protein
VINVIIIISIILLLLSLLFDLLAEPGACTSVLLKFACLTRHDGNTKGKQFPTKKRFHVVKMYVHCIVIYLYYLLSIPVKG